MFQQVFTPVDCAYLEIIRSWPLRFAFDLVPAVEDFIHFYGVFVPGESTRRLVRFNSSVALDLNRREMHYAKKFGTLVFSMT